MVEINPSDGFKLSDLLSGNGMVFEVDDYNEQEDDDAYGYSDQIQVTNDEMLKLLNMDNLKLDGEEEEEGDCDSEVIMPCSIPFEEYKQVMEDITGHGKIWKHVRAEGVGEVVPSDAMVTLNYVGYFEGVDEPFDSTYTRQSDERVRLSAGNLIPGLDIAIQSMKKDEIAHFIIHPDLAFGQFGCPPRILPNQEVFFAVKLVDFLDNAAADTFENLTYEEKKTFSKILQAMKARLATANSFFTRGNIKKATIEYSKVANILENARMDTDEEEEQQRTLLTRTCVNLAISYNKQGMPRKACCTCDRAPNPNAKCYYNHGKALRMLGEYTHAMKKLQQARELEPNDMGINREIQLVNDKYTLHRASEKQLWQNCFRSKDRITDEYSAMVGSICEKFAKDETLLRQPLPEALAPHEEKCFRNHAAVLGLNVTSHVRFGKEIVYMSKPKF